MEFEPMLTPRENPLYRKMSPEEDRTRDAVDSEPKHYQLSYFGPHVSMYRGSLFQTSCQLGLCYEHPALPSRKATCHS